MSDWIAFKNKDGSDRCVLVGRDVIRERLDSRGDCGAEGKLWKAR